MRFADWHPRELSSRSHHQPLLPVNLCVCRPPRGEARPSLEYPALHGLKIGVQVLDEEYTPPAEALVRRGLQSAFVGFDTIGEGADSIVRAVADKKSIWPLYGDRLPGISPTKSGTS